MGAATTCATHDAHHRHEGDAFGKARRIYDYHRLVEKTVLRVAMFSEPTLEYPVTLFPKYVPDITLLCDEFTADHPLSHPNNLVCE